MDCIVKAEAQITCAEYREYDFYNELLRDRKPVKYLFAHYPSLLAFILVFLLLLFIRSKDSIEYFLIFAAMLLILSPLCRFAVLKIGIPDGYTYEVRESTLSYIFGPDQFFIETKRNDTCTKFEFSYEDLSSAVKWKNAYYINAGDGRTYIIPARSISQGTPQMLEELLKEKLGRRYILAGWRRGKHRQHKTW